MQSFNLNLVPGSFQQVFNCSQGDIGRQLTAKLFDGSTAYEIPTGSTVKIKATKPSGFGFDESATFSGSTVTITTAETMTNEWGRFPAELVITKDGNVIGTANFLFNIEKNPHPDSTVDGDAEEVIPELTLLVERVEAAASSVLDMEVVATTLPAGSQASYSYDEDLNKATFGIPQGEAGAGAAGVVASAYSSSKTYKVGDYVLHNSNLYRCIVAITTAEAFTAAHWTQIVLADDVSDLKTDLDDLADTQEFVFLDETVSGTRSKGVTVNMPAGTYHFECDGVTSSDTQYTTSRVIFGYSGGSVAKDVSRGVAISVDYTFDHDITSITFYGAHNYSDSGGVTFSYDNVRISQPTNLGKRLDAVESKEEAVASDLANVKGDLEYPSVIENTAKTLTPGYTRTDILTNLELKKNKVYLINVSVKSWVNTVYFTLYGGGASLKTFSLASGNLSSTALHYCYADVDDAVLYCTTSAINQDITASIQEYPNEILTKRNEDKIKTIADSANYKIDSGFVRGGLAEGRYSSNQPFRVACTDMLYADRDLNLSIATGYRIGVQTFVNGNYSTDSGWIFGSYYIPKGTYFKIVISKYPEDTSTPADIDEYVNAVRINTYLLDVVKPLKTVGENLTNLGNPFKDGVYFSHIGVDQSNNIIIPCQSIADVSRTRRLGFKVLELNVRKTSDDKYVCLHGASGRFGYQFEDTNGNSVADVYVNSMTLAEIKNGIRFKSKYARYKTAPFSLQEMLYECKKQGIIPLVEYQSGYTDEIEILDSIMGKNNYILSIYNGNRGDVTDAMCTSWLTITDPTQLVNKCNASGGMYIAGLNVSDSAYSSFTDDDWVSLASAVHEAGYLIGFNTGYAGEVKSQKLLSLGYDVSGSGWNINDFEQGNLCNLFCGTDFSDFDTNGTVSNGTLSLTDGQTIAPTETLPSVFLGGGSLHIRFNGTISLVFGEHINATFTSDGTTEMWFSTYFEEASPTFLITSSGSTEIYDINYKASEM